MIVIEGERAWRASRKRSEHIRGDGEMEHAQGEWQEHGNVDYHNNFILKISSSCNSTVSNLMGRDLQVVIYNN